MDGQHPPFAHKLSTSFLAPKLTFVFMKSGSYALIGSPMRIGGQILQTFWIPPEESLASLVDYVTLRLDCEQPLCHKRIESLKLLPTLYRCVGLTTIWIYRLSRTKSPGKN